MTNPSLFSAGRAVLLLMPQLLLVTISCIFFSCTDESVKNIAIALPESLVACEKVALPRRASCFLEAAKRLHLQSAETAGIAAQQALQLSKVQGSRQEEAESLFWLALTSFSQAKDDAYAAPLAHARMSTDISKTIGYELGVAKGFALMGAILSYSDTLKAAESVKTSYRHLKNVRNAYKDSCWVAAYLSEIQLGLASRAGDLANTLRWMRLAPRLYAAANDLQRVGHADENIFKYYIQIAPNIDSARHYLKECVQYYEQSGATEGLRSATLNYAIACSQQYDQSNHDEIWFSEGMKAAEKVKQFTADQKDAEAEMQMGIFFQQKAVINRAKPDSLRYYSRLSYGYYRRALKWAEEEKNEAVLKTLTDNLQYACQHAGNCDSMMALTAQTYQNLLNYRREEAHQGQELLEQYKNEEAAQRRRSLILLGGIVLAAISLFFFWYYHRFRMKSLRRELEMKMEALRAQMNPHFISNCLNAIDSLVNHGKNQEASHYIIRFSRLCRMVLNNARHKFVSLSEELDMLEYFVSLEKLRFGDERLQYTVTVDTSLNKDDIAVPPMLLQPFVENAIWHGIQPKQGTGKVQVNITRMDKNRYQCTIEDDGIGRVKSQEIKSRSVLKQASHGMAITQERLEGFSGIHGAAIDIIDLQNDDGTPSGTKVVITLPIQPL